MVIGIAFLVESGKLVHKSVIFSTFSPLLELGLKSLLGSHSVHLLDSLRLSLPFLPRIGDAGSLRRILDTDSLVLIHVSLHYVEPLCTEIYLLGVGNFGNIFHIIRNDIFLGASGASIDEGEVTRLGTCAGNLE